MKNLTELTNQEIDQMVADNKKQVLEASRTYKTHSLKSVQTL
jgi:hypothetical protein